MRGYLKELREQKGFSQQNVADSIGITRQYYQQIENGERQKNMDVSLVVQLSNLFGIPPEAIIKEEQKRKAM